MAKNRKNKRAVSFGKQGFSLMEVLFVLFIMALGIALTLASFKDTKPLDEVEAATRQIAALIREAQNNSLTGKQQADAGSFVNICLNGIEWNSDATDSTTFTVYSYKSSQCDATGRINRTEAVKRVNLGSVQPANSAISFRVPSGTVNSSGFVTISGLVNSAQLKIRSTVNSSVFALVCVYPTGRVEEVFGQDNCPS